MPSAQGGQKQDLGWRLHHSSFSPAVVWNVTGVVVFIDAPSFVHACFPNLALEPSLKVLWPF